MREMSNFAGWIDDDDWVRGNMRQEILIDVHEQ